MQYKCIFVVFVLLQWKVAAASYNFHSQEWATRISIDSAFLQFQKARANNIILIIELCF